MSTKLNSRKLWLTVGVVATALCAAAGGQETWAQAVWQSTAAVLAYLGVQGAIDLKNTVKQ